MQRELTANRLSSMATGVMFFAVFGSGWLFWSLIARQEISATTAIAVEIGTLVLLAAAVYIKRQAKRWPRVPDDPRVGRAFAWITAIEWTAVAAVAFLCARFHWDAYLPSAVAVIVGLHFYPLARVFRNPLHYVTGTVLVVWASAAAATVPADRLPGITALGTGAILWAAAVVTLARGLILFRISSEYDSQTNQ